MGTIDFNGTNAHRTGGTVLATSQVLNFEKVLYQYFCDSNRTTKSITFVITNANSQWKQNISHECQFLIIKFLLETTLFVRLFSRFQVDM